MAEQSIGMTTGLGDGTAGGYTADRIRDMELKTFGSGEFLNFDNTQPFAMTGSGTGTLTIGIGNANVSGWFYQNTTSATISVATGVVNGTYSLVIVANNTAGTIAVTKTVAGVATVPAYTVRLALVSSLAGLTYIQIGTCVVTGGVLSAITYLNSYVTSLSLPYQTGVSMTAGSATITLINTNYDITSYTLSVSNNDGIFTPNNLTGTITVNRSGWYNIATQTRFNSGTTSYRRLFVTINGTQTWRSDVASSGAVNQSVPLSAQSYLTAGDVVKVQVQSGLAAQTADQTIFTMTMV